MSASILAAGAHESARRPPARELDRRGTRRGAPLLAYGVLALLLLAYLGLLIAGVSWPTYEGWGVGAFELAASAMCIASARTRRTARAVPVILGCSLMAWALGRLLVSAEGLGGAKVPSPSLADALYLSFFPLAYIALVLYLRGEVRRVSTPRWLDGLIAGLGAAAVCAAFAFHELEYLTGSGVLATAVNVAYPVGDVLLLLLIVTGISVLPARGKGPWLVIAAGIGLAVVGDSFNLFQDSDWSSHLGVILNGLGWPGAILLMSFAMWLPRVRSDPRLQARAQGFLLPGLAASASLAILCLGTVREVDDVAIGLATATLALVGVRMTSSVRTLRKLTHERQRLAVTDHLTGLANRRRLYDVLDAFFAEKADSERDGALAFLFIDLEHFKRINDSFGHPAGDELLRQVARRLTGSLEQGDELARIGGDEFGAVLIDADAACAEQVAERIRANLERPFKLEGVTARLAANIGIALAPADAEDSQELIGCADVAMYRAKLASAPYARFSPDFSEAGNRLRMAEQLQGAIERDELVLHYQPQFDLRTRAIDAVEALVRWEHPELGLIPPAKFLPLAEEAGLMSSLTLHVLGRALAQCEAWDEGGLALKVSVNVSATDLLDAELTSVVAGLLERHRQPAERLVIEITETSVIGEFERAKRVVKELREMGVCVSIDDFGAGFTSLAYLSSLAVGELKLDRSLITSLAGETNEQAVELVQATIALGHTLRLRVVAEGIEDEATLELLCKLRCDVAQGFLIGRPVPAAELASGPPRERRSPATAPATPALRRRAPAPRRLAARTVYS